MAEGDGTSRNFRSSYYEKLGFCGNEEKNILDLLIASSPFELDKLSDLSERIDLDRKCVDAWKILLGVESSRKNPFDNYANVKHVRAEHFQSLKHHVEVLLRHNLVIRNRLKICSNINTKPLDNHLHSHENTGNSKHTYKADDKVIESKNARENPNDSINDSNIEDADQATENMDIGQKNTRVATTDQILDNIEAYPDSQITLMYLLDVGRLESADIATQLDSKYCRKLSNMASFFVSVTSNLQEAFFLFRNFTKKLDENNADQNKT